MYVIKYDGDIYAGTYNDMDGCYLYPSSYFNMHCTSSEEYIFQADIDKEKAVGGFCNTVEEKANEMIVMIRECSNMEEIELLITDYINGDNNFIPSEED